MHVNFIAQPQEQLGRLLNVALDVPNVPTKVVLVSAFASLQAVLRLKRRLHELKETGAAIRLVVGVDMGGTSKEVLQELAGWAIEVFVFKNRKGGVTFHPKLYIVETADTAEVFLGSNNLTDGGLYGNYEGAVRVTYKVPAENAALALAKTQLGKFIDPTPPVGRLLDEEYLKVLLTRAEIPSDAESRKRRKTARGEAGEGPPGVEAFGFEPTKGPPRLPLEVQQVVIAAVSHQLAELSDARKLGRKKRLAELKTAKAASTALGAPLPIVPPEPAADPRAFVPLAQVSPTAFYLELTATGAAAPGTRKIPGEQRIPLEALNSAQEFWGWPDSYTESVNPRKGAGAAGEDRRYLNWRPAWRVLSVSDPSKDVTGHVRMYYYVNSSDFRFYSGALATWANSGDMVQITRCDNLPYAYECALAVAGTPEHAVWKARCSAASTHSPRVFGFA